MSKSKRWNVTKSGDRSLSDVKKDLKEAGFSVDQVHEEIGVITGVGFIGSGILFHSEGGLVRGVTTAATIFASCVPLFTRTP